MCRIASGLFVSGVLAIMLNTGCTAGGAATPVPQRAAFVRPLPETHEYARLLSKEEGVRMRSGLVTLEPGKDCGWHSTDNYEELIICLAGAGEVETEGTGRRPITAGQYAYNPPDLRHNVFNTGTALMRYIYVVAPAYDAPGHEH